MRKFHVCFAAVVLWVAGVAPATGQETQTIASVVGRFVVDFPAGELHESTQEMALKGADKETVHEMAVQVDNGTASGVTYMVIYEDFPPKYTKGAPQDFLAARRDTFLKGKTKLSEKVIDLSGTPGLAITASDDQQNYIQRLFLKGSRLYTLFVICAKGTTAAQASQFLESFQIQSF